MAILFILLLGLCVGSFIGAYTYRLPRGISIVRGFNGRSICPRCKKQIAWFDNIPVFSYLFLGGKCRNCHKAIGLREPLIEIGTGLAFAAGFLLLPIKEFLFLLPVLSILIAIFVIDLEHQIIPDELIFVGLAIVISAFLIFGFKDLFLYLLAGLSASVFLLAVNLATRGRGMGLGDVKLAIFIGTMLGPSQSLIWMFLSFVIGALVGIILMGVGHARLKTKIPFGPFMVIGFFVALLFGDKLLNLL